MEKVSGSNFLQYFFTTFYKSSTKLFWFIMIFGFLLVLGAAIVFWIISWFVTMKIVKSSKIPCNTCL